MEYQGITFTVVQTISKGWRWSVDQSEGERTGTTHKRKTAINQARRCIDEMLKQREEPKI